MKSILTLFFASILCFTNIQAQDYPEMVVDGATWINSYPTAGSSETYFVYHLDGDTIVNNIAYKILNLQDFEIGEDDILRVLDSGIPQALLREDVSAQKVYTIILDTYEFIVGDLDDFQMSRIQGEYENEYLLYDFSLDVGDVIEAPLPIGIFRIDEVERYEYEVRDFILDPGGEYYEKIGNPYSLFHPYQIFFIAGVSSWVQHYCGHDSIPCLFLTAPLSSKEVNAQDFSIYPNPVTDYVNFKLENDQFTSVQLYSSDGQLIHTIKDISLNEISLDLSNIHSTGLIYVIYEVGNSRYMDSFIRM